MKRCPKCGCETFCVEAEVVQNWKMDSDGEFVAVLEECVAIIHSPDDWDCWQCTDCGYTAEGSEFNIEEEE